MDYLVGDLQGCCGALDRLLAEIGFSPSRDTLAVLGDLVNRGPASLATLQRLHGLDGAATCVLGNHDLHLLAVAYGARRVHRHDTFDDVLGSTRRDAWIDWLRRQPLAAQYGGWLLLHAGVVPQWDAAQTLALAAEVGSVLAGPDIAAFLSVMYGDEPRRWKDSLHGPDRWRFVVNALTRMRFCDAAGTIDLSHSGGPASGPQGFVPWYDVPGRRTAGTPIACGHWSALGLLNLADVLAIDTGCVWGGTLTAVRVDGGRREVIQIPCEQSQAPG